MSGQTKNEIQIQLEREELSGSVWSIVRNDSITIDTTGLKSTKTKEELSNKDKVQLMMCDIIPFFTWK